MPGLRESWILTCGSRLIYETLPGKEVVYILPISSVLGRLPVVRAGDMGTILHKDSAGLRSCAHRFDHDLARADSALDAGTAAPMYFVNSWDLGWSRDMCIQDFVSSRPLSYCNTGVCSAKQCVVMCSNFQF